MKKNIYFYTNLFAWALVLFLIGNYAFGWVTPITDPPEGDLSSPLDTSSTAQIKAGDLTIDSLFKVGRYSSAPTGSTGALYYDTTANEFKGYKASSWGSLGASLWTQIGDDIYYNTGKVSIGTTTPSSKLHVQDGVVLFSGTTGSTPVSGAGTRLMWIPEKAAFRAGNTWSDYWDDAKIGVSSFASGDWTTASGWASTAMGSTSVASGEASTAMGVYTDATGDYSTAMGYATLASSWESTAMGLWTVASEEAATAMGSNTTASGFASTAMGDNTTASGNMATAMGEVTVASGEYSTAMGSYSIAIEYSPLATVTSPIAVAILPLAVGFL